MPKQIAFSKSLPLPSMVRREVAIGMMHNHGEMISLNPQVTAHRLIQTPKGAAPRAVSGYEWHELSEDMSHLSNESVRSVVTYKARYRNLHNGVDFHIYGPQGLDVKEQWIVVESPEPHGHGTPSLSGYGNGLWLRRDCNVTSLSDMSPVTEKNLYRAHQVFEERVTHLSLPQRHPSRPKFPFARTSSLKFSRLSSRSSIVSETDANDHKRFSISSLLDPSDTHPAFRNDVDWSLVSEEENSNPSLRTSSLTSRSSTFGSNSLRRRPNIYNRNERYSDSSSATSSYVDSPQLSPSPERCGSASTYYSTTASLPDSLPEEEEADDARCPKPEPEAYSDISGNPYTTSPVEPSSASTGSSTPSLTEESSDDESSLQLDEIQTPIDSADAAKIFEEMQKRYSISMGPPPIPKRASGHTVPAPLSIRSRSALSVHEGGTAYPRGVLPLRTSSMKRGSSRPRPRNPKKYSYSNELISTDETERMLSLSFGNGFSVYG